ncbi:MAG: hypothetical protein GX556_15350 [Fibrobacter sp.]|nr:hypothetical protein [Fibrobacter sp.]
MKKKSSVSRTVNFRWSSKVELYNYFMEKYSLDKEAIDREIEDVMAVFRPRKGQIIRTQELWQKVGQVLESKRSLTDQSSPDLHM